MKAVEGVESVEVDYDSGTATCKLKKGTDPAKVAGGLKGPYSASVQ